MSGDSKLVHTLIDRLTAKLPFRTGSDISGIRRDEIVALTRATLIEISKSVIDQVVGMLITVLGHLSKLEPPRYHSDLVLQSETYIVELLADCCSAHWQGISKKSVEATDLVDERSPAPPQPTPVASSAGSTSTPNGLQSNNQRGRYGSVGGGKTPPPSLDDTQAKRILDTLTRLLTPLSDDFHYPSGATAKFRPPNPHSSGAHSAYDRASREAWKMTSELDLSAYKVIEYISASNWSLVFNYIQSKLRNLRALSSNTTVGSVSAIAGLSESEPDALAGLQVLAHLWIDGRKLSLIIQELCGCFLHLRKAAQNSIALLLPHTIMRWLENNPNEFINLHMMQKKMEGGPDVLFDMSTSMQDSARRKGQLWPFQCALLLLLPEVFWVAGSMRETRSGGVAKKAAFLESLRKSIRSSKNNNSAATCLVTLCSAARLFPTDTESALLSYALDVQNELREELFRRTQPGIDEPIPDLQLMIYAFVGLCDLSTESVLEHLIPRCLDPASPVQFKLAVFAGCAEIARQTDTDKYQPIFAAIAPRIRSYLDVGHTAHLTGSLLTERKEMVSDQKRSASSNGASNTQRQPAQNFESTRPPELLYAILELLTIHPTIFFTGAPQDKTAYNQFFEKALEDFAFFLVSEDERIRNSAIKFSRELLVNDSLLLSENNRQRDANDFHFYFWKSTLTNFDLRDPGVKTALDFDLKAMVELASEMLERSTASVALEVAFLVHLCSSDLDICSTITNSLAVLCEEGRLMENMNDLSRSPLTIMRNYEVYSELSSQSFRLTGQVAFQKRFRRLLSRMPRPTAGVLTAWEAVFMRWKTVCRHIMSFQSGNNFGPDDKTLMEWRNYSGFLASLGGTCIAELPQAARVDDSMVAGLRWIDRLSPDGDGMSSLDRFMKISLQLLTCSNVVVREATREVLGTELSPRLYLQLFQSLEEELELIFDNSTDITNTESRVLFAEQAASLLRTIVDRLDDSQDTFFSVDFGSLALNLARYVHGLKDDITILRVKIKICQLCEAVTRKKEMLNLRHDVRIRNHLFQTLFEWMSRPGSPRNDGAVMLPGVRRDEMSRLQRDLDRACLKALVDIAYRLPLQPPEGHSDADTSAAKSQLFHTYFRGFLSLLSSEATEQDRRKEVPIGREETSSSLELAITALSNLLSANVDVGLKHSLEIGYHEDIDVRTAFMRVLSNILLQGTEFDSLSDSAISEKYDRLLELFISDMSITITLCDSCPSSEVDEMTISLLNIFDSRGMGFTLLKALIEHEIANTGKLTSPYPPSFFWLINVENESELLRRNCVATKMLTVYAKWKGSAYLKSTLQQVLERLMLSSEELDLELNPERTTSTEELQRNALQLRWVTNVFIDDICKSADKVPISFRKICYIIHTAVASRFPEAKFTAVGAFIFLRFFCPAIVAPDSEGLVPSIPTREMRRGLLLIAKVVQNLANNVLFGTKEAFMFPLNDFLTSNIIRVTEFLQKISTPPSAAEATLPHESFDFGSCVALHRFLYDHWDSVRQRLSTQDKRFWKDSSLRTENDHTKRDRCAALDSFTELVPSLGPPPMDISWNRPQISANVPPAYSRFQHFMLKNAGRNTESVISARVVYDGGESKDGLPVICVILRNIEVEGIDTDLLLYCFLKKAAHLAKIASRMWHRPFGILVDATCYTNTSEPQESFIRKMDSLTPSEMSKHLSRVYVYNMNSSYRKYFRRVLRLATKNENSLVHPNNVDYFLIGSLQELQTHFHLGSLHLPKDTISVVTDSRFVFQPVVKLSKTKGKVDVVIKVGSQFVQVTTTKKQEIVPGLRLNATAPGLRLNATVNDIFRLTDVAEANTSIYTDDDSAFGVRTENGKVALYFTSPRKQDILQAIRAAKAKQGKDAKPLKPIERLVRPEDVPGTLLNISLINMASHDQSLRLASYNLLCSLCRAFHFTLERQFVNAKGLSIPADSVSLVVGISERLASSEPQLTHDFLTEFFVGWDRSPPQQRPLNVLYVAPWLSNLRAHVLSQEVDSEKGKERLSLIARKFIDVALQETALYTSFQQNIWSVISRDEALVEIFLDEMVKVAMGLGFASEKTEVIGSIAASLGTITVRGKVIARFRKALNRTSLRPTRHLPENTVWGEICVLLRICLAISFDSRVQAQLFLPELVHIITMVVNCGPPMTRALVHKLLVNTVHSMCTSFPLEEANLIKLKAILTSLSEPKIGLLFSLHPSASRDGTFIQEERGLDTATFSSMETIANLLLEIIVVGAPSTDMANLWRSRWMSLVASTAFQSNPAIQPRAFAVMGCLAREDVDDDLLYQVLVALRSGVTRFIEDNDSDMLIAIVTSLTKMMDKLPSTSRYVLQLFWLAMSLVRFAPPILFNCTVSFLESVLQVIAASGEFKEERMIPVLLQGRLPVEEAASEIDELYGVRFDSENFHFASSACLAKGLSDPVTKTAGLRALSTFLEIASASAPEERRFPSDVAVLPYLGLAAARATTVEESREIFGIPPPSVDYPPADIFAMINLDQIRDKELLLNTAITLIDFCSCEEAVQQRALGFLDRVAKKRPHVLLHLYNPIVSILDELLQASQSPSTLRAAHALASSLAADSRFVDTPNSVDMLSTVLEEIGFSGLWRSSSFKTTKDQEKRCALLTDKLIESIIA